MGIIKAFSGAISGSFADQWKEIITAGYFDEQTVVVPGILKRRNNNRGVNIDGSDAVVTNGSKIFVPENTAAFIFNQSGIEAVITKPGGYIYQDGQESVFDGNGLISPIAKQIKERFMYGGQTSDEITIAFINLREIRNIKFGTHDAVMYHDKFYGTDLEINAYGTFSIIITDPVLFVRNFLPPNVTSYSFAKREAKLQLLSEFVQSFMVAVNELSGEYRISQLPSQVNKMAETILGDSNNAGTWEKRFGLKIVQIGIQDIEFAPESKELVRVYSSNKMNLKAYDDISQKASNIGAQQKIAQGIQDFGLGEGGAGLVFGMNFAQGLTPQAGTQTPLSIDEQIETLKKMKMLLDEGVLSQDEFDAKKKEIMGL